MLIPVKSTLFPNAMSGRPVGCDVVVVTECCSAWYWPSAVMLLPPSVALPGPPWHSVSKLIGDLVRRQNQVTIGLGQQALKTLALRSKLCSKLYTREQKILISRTQVKTKLAECTRTHVHMWAHTHTCTHAHHTPASKHVRVCTYTYRRHGTWHTTGTGMKD